jgi:superfamily II DNA or RNA helicase
MASSSSLSVSATKAVLLLQPLRLLYGHPVVQILLVHRRPGGLEMEELPLVLAHINKYFKGLAPEAKKYLLKLQQVEIEKYEVALGAQFRLQRQHTDADRFRHRGMAAYYQQQLGFVKQLAQGLSWYHRLPHGSANVKTAPCTYHPYTVQAAFALLRQGDEVGVEVRIVKGNEELPLAQFQRFYFLLEHHHTYYHLGLKSFEAIEWLGRQPHQWWPADDAHRTSAVLQHLQSFGLPVQAHHLLPANTLSVLPTKRVVLSELNNAFLMLTPQFVYEGQVVEGSFAPTTTIEHLGGSLHIERHRPSEDELTTWLRALHPNFARQTNGFFYLTFADAQRKGWFLKVYHQLLQFDIELLGMDMLRHFKYSPHTAQTACTLLGQRGNLVCYTMQVSFGADAVPLSELQKMLLNGQKAVLLKDGSLGVLGEAWLQQYSQAVKHGKVQKNELLLPRWLAMAQPAEAIQSPEPATTAAAPAHDQLMLHRTLPQDWWWRLKHWQTETTPLYELPPQLSLTTLRPYQQKGYEWLRLLAEVGGSACLADDMGLGKTLQTISFLLHRLQQLPAARHLVVCPASLMYNWQQELQKFAPTVVSHIYHGASRSAQVLAEAHHQITITSYGTMRQDIDLLAAITFDVAVLDESHHIKNPATEISRAAAQLVAGTRIALSGTPVMNGTVDLYAQMEFLLPGLLGSREFFKREYVIPIEQQGDKDKAAALQKIISPFVLRRTKQQGAPELPAKTETILWCNMGHNQRQAYETIKENVQSSVMLGIKQHGLKKSTISVLAGLTKLRQACNSPELVTDQDLFCSDSIKTDLLLDELKNLVPRHKVLVFSQFTGMLDVLETALTKASLAFLRLDGQTPPHQRQALVNRFQAPDSPAHTFLISLQAGNAGLNLTAAEYVFLVDPWWNHAVENQAIDRTHRIGQTAQVFVYRLICKHSIEEKIIQLASKKKVLAEDLVATDESFVKRLTLEDIAYLLQ